MQSSVRLIVPGVPDGDLLDHGGFLTQLRLDCWDSLSAIHQQMADLVARTRELPGGYPTLVLQRRSDRQSCSLRWLSGGGRMLSDARFHATVFGLPPVVRAWLLHSQFQACWLNSQERVCRILAGEYAALSGVLAKSSSPAVSSDSRSSDGSSCG